MQFEKQTSTFDQYSDAELIALYKNSKDLKPLAALYERYMALVYGVCLKYLKNEEDTKDAVMQLFEELITKLQKHHVENFKSWLHVVAKNFCLMQLRKNPGQNNAELKDDFMQLPAMEHHTEKEAAFSLLEKCLETLNHEQRTAIQLFYLEEKCYKDVAEITGYATDKVRSYIQNGRRNLKLCMDKNSE
ncbi:RNA polymerase subunit sigma-70 [Arachidicoccus ginsenosidimutans]|uniref:RNA polymerase sigma factor n=1 Tax=Arachidicoccus sp. BS20 TaxID=1850526 RepID=UPI0007F12621|nr:sigma-70 family RNA polymerase sigma factor [Arachidicoccus sp. BS20]ANI90320.1 RNA polymerase subunit sigma-70 [Arachidicoccus sp. BS20]